MWWVSASAVGIVTFALCYRCFGKKETYKRLTSAQAWVIVGVDNKGKLEMLDTNVFDSFEHVEDVMNQMMCYKIKQIACLYIGKTPVEAFVESSTLTIDKWKELKKQVENMELEHEENSESIEILMKNKVIIDDTVAFELNEQQKKLDLTRKQYAEIDKEVGMIRDDAQIMMQQIANIIDMSSQQSESGYEQYETHDDDNHTLEEIEYDIVKS